MVTYILVQLIIWLALAIAIAILFGILAIIVLFIIGDILQKQDKRKNPYEYSPVG